jgi:hypothetical protein
MEHTRDIDVATEIALDHLAEIPDYYTRLEEMEDEAKAEMAEEGFSDFSKKAGMLSGIAAGTAAGLWLTDKFLKYQGRKKAQMIANDPMIKKAISKAKPNKGCLK